LTVVTARTGPGARLGLIVWVQARHRGVLSDPFPVCRSCGRALSQTLVMEFDEDVTVSLQEWNAAAEVEEGLRDLGLDG
jgi:hypothetical protein